ncbi:platelet-activating factor acetylhydrolase isoform II [Saccharothrix saharensis]|uniref:Platelet-activating factor acetylhydrolase isoform II n=1 Tax=Saccharothrix saharensis TaxID=571190 RepID=A0A543JAH4_9PSEU|nr:alpha/beta hydrolase [Saccharothrix saharensis]TQM79809.1 platelet-activating factor acetylhydrolase isoform II [Saccharothrix saharensis]
MRSSLTFLIALSLVLSATPAHAAGPEPDATPSLPAPTGRHPVGTTSLHLTDTTRPDPWVPGVRRELMVSLFYPAASARGPKKQYMTPTESRAVLEDGGLTTVPPDVLSTVRTNAVVDARPVGRRHGLPLVVLSPGYKRPRATLTALAEDLASHGYVVAVVDHTHENVATTFPDGRVAPCASCGLFHDPAFWQKLGEGRAVDVSFVLDQLSGPLRDHRGANLVDAARIAVGGHSVGGASSLEAARADARIRAAIDVDGVLSTPVPPGGMAQPVMLLGRQNNFAPGAPSVKSWADAWPLLTGWKRWLVVAGMEHPSFTDIGVIGPQLGLDFGEVPGERGAAITRAYVRAFFDRHLRGEPQPLLDGPSASYPEVSRVEPSS